MFIFVVEMVKEVKSALGLVICLIVCGLNFSVAGNSFVWNLLGTQIEIGLNQRNNVALNVDSTLSMQQTVGERNEYDLVSELEKCNTEDERLGVLENYISVVSSIVSTSSSKLDNEKKESDKYVQLSNDCKNQASKKNSEFSAAVKKGDYVTAQKIADEIAQLRSCEASNKVYAKEHMTYGSANKNISKLQRKADYISKNKETIAKYYEILKPDLLKELYDISQTVKVNF